jgi:hypothetical protein
MAKKRAYPEPVKYRVKNLKKYKGDATNVWYRSQWEKKVMLWFDFHPNVVEWSSEEVVIPYLLPETDREGNVLGHSQHRYFMDFSVVFEVNGKRKKYLVEVKPYEQTQPPKITEGKKTKTLVEQANTYIKNKAKWEAAEAYCKSKGWGFQILTEYELGMAK